MRELLLQRPILNEVAPRGAFLIHAEDQYRHHQAGSGRDNAGSSNFTQRRSRLRHQCALALFSMEVSSGKS